MKKVLIFNLTPRMWMLHYSAQFSNELARSYQVWTVIADYYDGFLYDNSVKLLKIRTSPTAKDFVVDSLMFRNQIKIWVKIKEFKPEIVHFMDNHPRYPFYARISKLLWYKIYVTQHDPILHSGDNKWLQWKVAAWVNKNLRNIADKIIVNWDVLKQEMISLYRLPESKLISVPHWNYNFFTKWWQWWKAKKNYFLFFWRISDYKWLDILLESLDKVRREIPDFKLIIAWNWDIKKYEKLLNKFKDNIEMYHCDIPDEEVYKYFEMSEFVVLPYKNATWSWVIPTAFAFSKPVITTNVWELATHVINKKSWLIIEPNNVEELSEVIIWMLNNKEKVVEMWKEWRKYTEEALWWDKIVEKIYL